MSLAIKGSVTGIAYDSLSITYTDKTLFEIYVDGKLIFTASGADAVSAAKLFNAVTNGVNNAS